MSYLDLVKRLESILTLPSRFSAESNQIVYEPVADCIVLTCGNLISETLYLQLSRMTDSLQISCPVCFKQNVKQLALVSQMRDLYIEYDKVIDHLPDSASESSDWVQKKRDKQQQQRRRSSSKKSVSLQLANKMSLLTAFHDIVNDLNNNHQESSKSFSNSPTSLAQLHNSSPEESNVGDWILTMNDSTTLKSFKSNKSNDLFMGKSPINVPLATASNLTSAIKKTSTNISPTLQPIKPAISTTKKELLYAKNFPFFRKQIQHSTHTSKFFLKGRYSKLFINTDISPDLTKFVLLSEKKFEVYSMNPTDPSQPPNLLCIGKTSGEYGKTSDTMIKPSMNSLVANSNNATDDNKPIDDVLMDKLLNWEHLYCKLSDNFLIIAGTRGLLRIYNLNQSGKPIYTYYSRFPIRCVDISNDEKFISIGITGKDKFTNTEQALIVLLRLEYLRSETTTNYVSEEMNSSSSSSNDIKPQSTSDDFKFKVIPITVTLPYRDPINILKFSPNSLYLSCSTALESRFVIISIVNPDEPKLIMKSLRSLDTSLESEGITDLTFFPDNRLMTITSVAFNASPIVIDTRITSINGIQGILQPLMLMRVDEVGSSIHKASVSPRGDAILFLDRNGLVYIMSSPHMDDSENKRVVVVAEVSNAYRMREAATLRFDKDGYKLFIIDRKGVLYIEDFTAGPPQSHEITRCKLIC